MIEGIKPELFLGKVTKVKDRETYEIEVEIPGVGKDFPAVPLGRGEIDEPVEGNLVMILALDPIYHRVNYYAKLKENNFIGVRSNGKVIDITPDYIVVGSDGSSKTNPDPTRIPAPSLSYMKMDDAGNIEVMATANETVTIKGDCSVSVEGNVTVDIKGTTTVNATGKVQVNANASCTVKSPEITLKGGNVTVNGTFNAKGNGSPGTSGSFCAIPSCLFTGAPHKSTSTSGN